MNQPIEYRLMLFEPKESWNRSRAGKRISISVMFCILLLFPSQALAWGSDGHQIVARIAMRQLSPAARQALRELLKPGETLATVANWADQIRQSRPETKRWHYVDIPLLESGYEPVRDCAQSPFGDCVIQALVRSKGLLIQKDLLGYYRQVLADQRESRQARYEALKFLVHFIGDLHQPLHCADNNDAGGNDLRLTFFGRATNLHKVWDTDIIVQAGGANTTANRVEVLLRTRDLDSLRQGTFVDWAVEAHLSAAQNCYQGIPANKRLGQPYFQKNRPIVDEQLLKAGVRLAGTLNEVFQ